jgi:hypothetical protein
MVPLIEDQIHKFLIDQEEERCKAIEAAYDKNLETKGKRVQRKTITKPWIRAVASALCQEADLLPMVSQYDYDLSDAGFQTYCSTRGTLHVAGEPGGRRWKYFAEYQINKDAFLADPYFQLSQEVDGKRIRYTDGEMETGWKIMKLGRAQLQDCWELYRKKPQKTKSD